MGGRMAGWLPRSKTAYFGADAFTSVPTNSTEDAVMVAVRCAHGCDFRKNRIFRTFCPCWRSPGTHRQYSTYSFFFFLYYRRALDLYWRRWPVSPAPLGPSTSVEE